MDLTQLQAELRAVERKMSELQAEIEKMKPRPENEVKQDYAKIEQTAKRNPISIPMLKNAGEYEKKSYLSGLSFLAFARQPHDTDRLLYLSELAAGMNVPAKPEELVKMGMRVNENSLDGICDAVRKYRYSFVLDALVLANIHGQARAFTLESIADMARLLGCSQEDMRITAQIAKCTLTDNFDALDKIPPAQAAEYAADFKGRISENWLKTKRRLQDDSSLKPASISFAMALVAISLSRVKNEKTKAAGSFVNRGEELVSFDFNKGETEHPLRMVADTSGCFYTIKRSGKVKQKDGSYHSWKKTYYYVVSPFDDLDALEKWHDKQHPHPEKE